jgi:catechol 2,3-dioxygenase-like lactoylglutathione lyase family enzyme
MLDHIGLDVASYQISKRFYELVLAPLGYGIVEETHGFCGFGPPGKPLFWIHEAADGSTTGSGKGVPIHVGFAAANRPAVDAFYAAAIAAGARDNGPPGLREIYHPNYYGAFVFDPDGYNVEAVCHLPESPDD